LVLPGRGLGLFESTVPSRGGASLNFVDFGLEGKGRLLSLGSLFTVFEDFPLPSGDSIFLEEVQSEGLGGNLFIFLGSGCHVTLWMSFSSVLAVSIKTPLSG
jgi:hypothetical protein